MNNDSPTTEPLPYTPIPHRPRIFFLFGGMREVSLFFFSNRDELRVIPDSDTMSLRIFGAIGSIRLDRARIHDD